MILSLRRRHCHVFAVLAIVLPLSFAAGIAARKVPAVADLPNEVIPHVSKLDQVVWRRNDLFPKALLQARLFAISKDSQSRAIEFIAAKDFARPDLLVYWIPGVQPIADRLPESAILIGTIDSVAMLPANVGKTEGVLVLYSLADAEIVDVSKPLRLGDAMK